MIEVAPNLFVGSQDDEAQVRGLDGWYIISAAKEPYHRAALGYTGRAAPMNQPGYLMVRQSDRLILNLVDVDDPAYIHDLIIDTALIDIYTHLDLGKKVLVHCNQGQSRAPTIALLYLRKFTHDFDGLDYAAAVEKFKTIYPPYAPARGMAEYGRQHWSDAGA